MIKYKGFQSEGLCVLDELDELLAKSAFANRSKGIQEAVREKLERMKRTRLAREGAKLDPREERVLSEEALGDLIG